MGQKRRQNIIDQKIGTHLAEFQKKLTDSLEQSYFNRIDKLNRRTQTLSERTDEFGEELERSAEILKANRQFVEKYEMKMHLNYLITSLIGGMMGGIVMFFLMWYVW